MDNCHRVVGMADHQGTDLEVGNPPENLEDTGLEDKPGDTLGPHSLDIAEKWVDMDLGLVGVVGVLEWEAQSETLVAVYLYNFEMWEGLVLRREQLMREGDLVNLSAVVVFV